MDPLARNCDFCGVFFRKNRLTLCRPDNGISGARERQRSQAYAASRLGEQAQLAVARWWRPTGKARKPSPIKESRINQSKTPVLLRAPEWAGRAFPSLVCLQLGLKSDEWVRTVAHLPTTVAHSKRRCLQTVFRMNLHPFGVTASSRCGCLTGYLHVQYGRAYFGSGSVWFGGGFVA